MTKNIIFPINNKGGVGKTSVLTDLCAALAQRYSVGIIDYDDQASLASTFLQQDLACQSLDSYNLKTQDVTLNPATEFLFSDQLQQLVLTVQETKAKVAVFPAGLLYDYPEKKTELERIVRQDMKDASFIAIDLPPIPHPGMIFDYTLMPLIQAVGPDVRLFPLIITTPDHNVVDIALRGFNKIAQYLHQQEISEDKIHPLFVLNKVPMEEKEQGKLSADLDSYTSMKLNKLGLIYCSESMRYSGINHINKFCTYEGKRFRSSVFPIMPKHHDRSLQDKFFSLFYGNTLNLYHYPHLVDLVKSHKFLSQQKPLTPEEKIYMYSLRQMVCYLAAKSQEKPFPNYHKQHIIYNPIQITSGIIQDLQTAITQDLNSKPIPYTDKVLPTQGYCETGMTYFCIPSTVSKEQMAKIIYATQRELDPSASITLDQISSGLTEEFRYGYTFAGDVEINSPNVGRILKIIYPTTNDAKPFIHIGVNKGYESEVVDSQDLLLGVNVFLRHLGRSFKE